MNLKMPDGSMMTMERLENLLAAVPGAARLVNALMTHPYKSVDDANFVAIQVGMLIVDNLKNQ